MTLPLLGRRVLVPVTEARRDLAELLRAAGAEVTEAECIAIAPPADKRALETAAARWIAGDYDWLAVTSRNAVLALAQAALPHALGHGGLVAAVGRATTQACSDAGLTVDVVPARADAAGLVAAIPDGPGRVLAPVGNLAPAVLERGLTRKGWDVDLVEAYRTIDGPGLDAATVDRVLRGDFDAMVLTSSSVAQRIRRDLGEAAVPHHTVVIAIGGTTAAGAREVGLEPTAISATPSHEGILETLIRLL